jgi:hypothetical protein
LAGLEVGAVVFGHEGALMVIEPPGEAGRGEVLEVDDGVFAGAEVGGGDASVGLVGESAILVGGGGADALAMEPGEDRGGAGSVEALVVMQDAKEHGRGSLGGAFVVCCLWSVVCCLLFVGRAGSGSHIPGRRALRVR